MAQMSGAKALIEALERQKTKVMFGICGGSVLPIYDELYDSRIRHILSRHEQCAAHAADGYARASGKTGVCIATSGPGATNLVTGIANAYMDSSPVVALTGQVNKYDPNSSWLIGRDAFQEADIVGITTPITKYNCQVSSAAEIPKAVHIAFHIASTGRPGPVLIDIPRNVQSDTAEMEFLDSYSIRGYKSSFDLDLLQVKKAAEAFLNAERPVIIAGGGVMSSGAWRELLALAEFLMIPVATTLMGKGCFPENHPMSLGIIGMHGTQVANELISEADVLIAVGMRFSDRSTGKSSCFCPDAEIIQIDIDSAEIGKNIDVDVPIVADCKIALPALFEAILNRARKYDSSLWLGRVKELADQFRNGELRDASGHLSPQLLLSELRKMLPEEAIVATEVGQNQMWAAQYFKAFRPRTFITSGGLGTMGFGFPASLGAKVACPNRTVVDIAGDGSFMMTEQELACSVSERIPVTVIVLNNSMLGMVAQWQRLFYNRRYSAVNLGHIPDFVKLAEAYDAQGIRAGSLEEFRKAVKEALQSEVTTVIDVPICPEENVLPMIPPGKSLSEMIFE